ncbi:MAG TPA: PKD domain-containing protein [Thermoplasmata archaeon]|nr:PKD domain-containing protein [Thermoplasmata archaeon]
MRTVLVLLMTIVLTNAVPGGGVSQVSEPVPFTASCTFRVHQNATAWDYTVQPVERAQSVVSFYDYSSASAHTPFVDSYASVLFLYRDTGTGNLYFVFHFNIDNVGTPDAETDIGLQGIPSGAGLVLSDDPGEFSLSRYPQGQFHYFFNTDGGVLGPLPGASAWSMAVDIAHFGSDPMRSQTWVDGNGTRLPLAIAIGGLPTTHPIVVESACNQAPAANAGGPYSGLEGSPITFNAGGSSDPDGDPLTYTWDFTNDGTDDATTTSPTIAHAYPDDFVGKAELSVSDGTTTSSATVDVTVSNVAPVVVLDALLPSQEGDATLVQIRVTDPGADAVFVEFDQGDTRGPIKIGQLFNPQNALVTTAATWGDDGLYSVQVTATDDDGGRGDAGAITRIDNEIPGITAVTNPSATTYDEGDEADMELRGRDNGSDDLRIEVDFGNQDVQSVTAFNDGIGPDPDPSPLGTYPFEVLASFTTRYVDDGAFTIRVTASDDDGGVAFLEFSILVRNVAPTIEPFGPGLAVEGSPGALTATATDPGDDALTFAWEFELGPTRTASHPASGSPTTASDTAPFLYGDDGSYRVTLTVTDDDGESTTFETTVEVTNAAPTAQVTQVSRSGSFVLRVAGEKYHDVWAIFSRNTGNVAEELERVGVVRTPGSPDEQAEGTAAYDLMLADRFTAKVLYTPEDDPVNGQPNGADPVWILVLADDGTEVARVHHTFNVEHPGTYEWDVDLTQQVAQLAVRFSAEATDAGSDDLTFAWDFGDLTVVESVVVYNDGAAPDPSRSPGGTFPFTATVSVAHAFPGPGTYVITLTVTDDDGGIATATFVVTILG